MGWGGAGGPYCCAISRPVRMSHRSHRSPTTLGQCGVAGHVAAACRGGMQAQEQGRARMPCRLELCAAWAGWGRLGQATLQDGLCCLAAVRACFLAKIGPAHSVFFSVCNTNHDVQVCACVHAACGLSVVLPKLHG